MSNLLMKKCLIIVLISIILYILSAIPKTLNYQGKLVNSEGIGINDTLDFTFSLYTSESGGTTLWTETISEIPVRYGLFSVELGVLDTFPDTLDFSQGYYLEVQAGSEILTPREKFTSSPYSIRAGSVERAIQSVYSSENTTLRTGNLMFTPGDGATLSERGDSIIIAISGSSAGVSVEAPLSGTGLPGSYLSIDYDDVTIGMNLDEKLAILDDAITGNLISDESISEGHLTAGLLSSLAPVTSGSGYIQNQIDSIQSGSFKIDGQVYIGGNIGIGIESPLTKLHINGVPGIGPVDDYNDITNYNLAIYSDGGSGASGKGGGIVFTENNFTPLAAIVSVDEGGSASTGIAIRTGTVSGNNEVARFTYNGNVGIGTSQPGSRLHIKTSQNPLIIEGAANTSSASNMLNNLPNQTLIIGGSWSNKIYFFWKDQSGNKYYTTLTGTSF